MASMKNVLQYNINIIDNRGNNDDPAKIKQQITTLILTTVMILYHVLRQCTQQHWKTDLQSQNEKQEHSTGSYFCIQPWMEGVIYSHCLSHMNNNKNKNI